MSKWTPKGYQMDIDELHTAIFTSIGVVFEGIDEIKTPFKNDLDELRMDLASLDEIKVVKAQERATSVLNTLPPMTVEQKRLAKKLVDDDILEYLVYAYTRGIEVADSFLEGKANIDEDRVYQSVYRETKGKTWKDRVAEAIDTGKLGGLLRIADTEFHRTFNTSILDGAKQLGGTTKVWQTMADDKVRDTHDYLEGMEVPIDEKFYTYDGDSANFPGDFLMAENNVNCRCFVMVK